MKGENKMVENCNTGGSLNIVFFLKKCYFS